MYFSGVVLKRQEYDCLPLSSVSYFFIWLHAGLFTMPLKLNTFALTTSIFFLCVKSNLNSELDR